MRVSARSTVVRLLGACLVWRGRSVERKHIIVGCVCLCVRPYIYVCVCAAMSIPGRLYPVSIYHSKTRQVMTAHGPSSNAYVQSAVELAYKIHTTVQLCVALLCRVLIRSDVCCAACVHVACEHVRVCRRWENCGVLGVCV